MSALRPLFWSLLFWSSYLRLSLVFSDISSLLWKSLTWGWECSKLLWSWKTWLSSWWFWSRAYFNESWRDFISCSAWWENCWTIVAAPMILTLSWEEVRHMGSCCLWGGLSWMDVLSLKGDELRFSLCSLTYDAARGGGSMNLVLS